MNKKILLQWLDEFATDMIKKFEEHNDKYHDFNPLVSFEDLKGTDVSTLRYEVNMHHAKWLYRGIHKKDMPETDALVNAANMQFLLWIRLKKELENQKR